MGLAADMILPFAARRSYAELDCFGREEINERIWWLADPLYLEAGNERKTEHMVRRTVIALSLDREIDEGLDWRKQYVPGPLIALYVRYGVPHSWDPPRSLWTRVMGMDDETTPDGWDRMDSTFHPWRRFDTKSLNRRASRDPVYPACSTGRCRRGARCSTLSPPTTTIGTSPRPATRTASGTIRGGRSSSTGGRRDPS